MKTLSAFLLTAFLALSTSAAEVLNFEGGNLQAELTWLEHAPLQGSENFLKIQWRTAAGELTAAGEPTVPPGDFRVMPFMPEMGHGSSPTKIQALDEIGAYRVSRVFFTMPGLWEVRVILKKPDGSSETRALGVMF